MSEVIVGSVGVQLVPSAEGFAAKAKGLLSGLTADVRIVLDDTLARAGLEDLTRPRETTVTANADTGAAEAQLAELTRPRKADVNVDDKSINSARSGMGALVTAALLLGPALSPLTAVFAGVTAVAGVATAAILDVEKTQKKIDQLRQTAAATTSKKTAAAATAQADFLQKSLSKTQGSFLAAQAGLKNAFNGLLSVIGPALFRPLTAGLQLLTAILPQLVPLISQVSGYFGDLIEKATTDVSNGGLTTFLQYVMQVMPQVFSTIGALVGAIIHIGIALAPLGGIVLQTLGVLANIISAIPPDVLGAIAAGILAVVVATKAWSIAAGILNVILDANPIGAIVIGILGLAAALVYAYNNSETFRAVVTAAFEAVKGYITGVLIPVIQGILNVFLIVAAGIAEGAAKAFGWVPGLGGKLKAAAENISAFRDYVNATLSGIQDQTVTIKVNIVNGKLGPAGGLGPSGPKGSGLGTVGPGGKVGPAGPKFVNPTKVPSFSTPKFNSPKFGGAGGGKSAAASAAATARKEARSLLAALTAGIKAGGTKLTDALSGVLSHIADFPKKFRSHLREVVTDALAQTKKIAAIKTAMTDLANSIKDAFSPDNLFAGTIGALRGGLTRALVNVRLAAEAQKRLLAAGVAPAFVSAVLASGNGALAAQLAASPDLAKDFSAQFAQVNSLASQLGTSQAGAQFNPQLASANALLQKQLDELTALAPKIGAEIKRNIPKGRGR